MPRTKEQTLPAAEPVIQQSLPSENNNAGIEDSPVHMTGSPPIGRTVSSAGSGTDLLSRGNSAGNTNSTPVTVAGDQQYGSAGNASLHQKIRAALQANLVYPYIARKKQMEGSVMVSFRVDQRGKPEAIRILKGSGYSILDSAARDTVVKASPFPAMNRSVEVPITFTLKDN
jgi:TonB family protein